MTGPDLSRAIWRKSSHSSSGEGTCVEVARLARTIAVRDSTNPAGPALAFSSHEWRGLLTEIKTHRA
jgi:hypothetical protein